MSARTAAGRLGLPPPALAETAQGPVEYAAYGRGPAVLCLHGALGGYDQGLMLARSVGPDGCRFIAPSRPGYLGTPLSVGAVPQAQADACAALLDGLGIEAATVMAISGGGPCALQFALRHRDRCRGLVLVSACGGVVRTRLPVAYHVIRLLARFPWLTALLRPPGRVEQAARRSIPDAALRARVLRDPRVGPLFEALLASTSERLQLRLPGTENDIRVTRSTSYPLEQVAVPTLVVHGTADRVVPYAEHGAVLARRIPGARLLAVEGAEHVAIFTHNEQVRGEIGRFLEGLGHL